MRNEEVRDADTANASFVSLTRAALEVIRVWHEDVESLSGIGEAIAGLQEVLEAMGARYVAPEHTAPERE